MNSFELINSERNEIERTPLGVKEKSVCCVENIKWCLIQSHHHNSNTKINNKKNWFKMNNYLRGLFDTVGFIRWRLMVSWDSLSLKGTTTDPVSSIPRRQCFDSKYHSTGSQLFKTWGSTYKRMKMKERVGRDGLKSGILKLHFQHVLNERCLVFVLNITTLEMREIE